MTACRTIRSGPWPPTNQRMGINRDTQDDISIIVTSITIITSISIKGVIVQ